MSCYLCGVCHLTALAHYARREGIYRARFSDEPEREIVDLLARANWESVRARYPHHPDPGVVQGLCEHGRAQHPSAMEIVKAAHCLEHQCDEAPSWEGSEACRLLRQIVRCAVTQLDGYEAEAWDFECLHTPEPRPAPKPHPKPRRQAGLENWLGVDVYRAEQDCSAGGITSITRTLYVPHEGGPIQDPPYDQQLVTREAGGAMHFVPRVLTEEGAPWSMFGGNYVVSSDGRFCERYGRQPIAVHDRVEKRGS